MGILDEAESILAKRPDVRKFLNQPLPFNTCHLDKEYCLYQKKCLQCPKMGGKR